MPPPSQSPSKKRPREQQETKKEPSKSDGLTEIDALFDDKFAATKKLKQQEKEERKKQQQQSKKHSKTCHSKSTLSSMTKSEWKDDGLGGKFNHEGFTGRREDGVKVFKAHLFNKPNFGKTPECPFDCNCCFI